MRYQLKKNFPSKEIVGGEKSKAVKILLLPPWNLESLLFNLKCRNYPKTTFPKFKPPIVNRKGQGTKLISGPTCGGQNFYMPKTIENDFEIIIASF